MLKPILSPILKSTLRPIINRIYPVGAVVWKTNGSNLLINGKQVIS